MKKYNTIKLFWAAAISLLWACSTPTQNASNQEDEHAQDHANEVELSQQKFNSLKFKVDTLHQRQMQNVIFANGQLEVPPQHEATVTAILGGNITQIKVIEGNKVKQGQLLAFLAHPELAKLQSAYIRAFHQAELLKKELDRQQKLHDENVGAGKKLDEVNAEYLALQGEVKGYEAQLRQLNLNAKRIQNGDIYDEIPVRSPIDGFIEKVRVQIGQYAQPQTPLFSIVNTEHIHADFMVFEKDVPFIKEDQIVEFTTSSNLEKTFQARVFSVGKIFEMNPKAVHVHAEIISETASLIPGMYIKGRVLDVGKNVPALPDEAIVNQDGKQYIFMAKREADQWHFTPIEIKMGTQFDGWSEIIFMENLPKGALLAHNNAYQLMAELKKNDSGHDH